MGMSCNYVVRFFRQAKFAILIDSEDAMGTPTTTSLPAMSTSEKRAIDE